MNLRDKLARLTLQTPASARAQPVALAHEPRIERTDAYVELPHAELDAEDAATDSHEERQGSEPPVSASEEGVRGASSARLGGDRASTIATLRDRLAALSSAPRSVASRADGSANSTREGASMREGGGAPSPWLDMLAQVEDTPRSRTSPRDRLRAAAREGEGGWTASPPVRGARLPAPPSALSYAALISGDTEEVARARELQDATLPGERCATAHGDLHRLITTYADEHRHGAAAVALGRTAHPGEVAMLALDPSLAEVDFSRALYIDTETTGLMGGSGTLPFLIGMAWFEGEQLSVEQLLLPRPGLEVPLLARLAERMRAASAIVSYNGKSFDWPLLRTRFILNRLAAPPLPPHLDLLHCARRVYKARLGSVRLVYLEQELLGYERIGDLPGELIPATYFAYLRGELSGATLAPVLEHNRSDLVALPALLGELVRRFRGEHAREHARDQLGFARVAARAKAGDRALACAHAAVERDVRGELTSEALTLVGELKRERGDIDGALAAFEGALAASVQPDEAARAHLALAKLHEHKTKAYGRALDHARQTAACEGEEASRRRVARLEARIARAEKKRTSRTPRSRLEA